MHKLAQVLMFIGILYVPAGIFAQTKIKVVDKHTGEGLPYANLCFESISDKSKSYSSTGIDGTAENNVKSVSLLAVSYVGYHSRIDTIRPDQSITVSMEVSQTGMDEVVVTGQFKPQLADKSIYRVEVLGADKIEAKAASTLTDLLQSDLIFRTSQSGVLGAGLSMQGLGGENVKILIDGVPVIGRQNGMIDLGQISLDNVDHIETVKGPMSVIYGSNATAGAINIITRTGSREKFGSSVSGYYESVGVYNFDASLRTKVKKSVFNLNGGRNFFDGYSPIDLGRFQLWKPKQQYNFTTDWLWTNEKWKVRLNQSWFDEEVRDRDSLRPPRYENALDQYYYTTRLTSRAEASLIISDRSGFDMTGAWSYYRKEKKTTVNDLVNLVEQLADQSKQDTTIFRNAMWRANFYSGLGEKINYQAGLDFNFDEVTGKRIEGAKNIGDMASFFSFQWTPFDKLTFQPGARLIYNTLFKAPLVHSLNMLWNPSEHFLMRASAGRGFRSPTIKELFMNFQDINHNVTGNKDLTPEYSWNYNLSFSFGKSLGRVNISDELALFHSRMQDKIDFIYRMDDPTWAKYFNIAGLYKTQGIEEKITFGLHPRFKLNLGGSFIWRSKLSDLDKYYFHSDYVCDWTYHNLKYDFTLAMFYKYTDRMFTAVGNFDDEMNLVTEVVEWYQDSYQTIDFTASRPFFRNRLTLALGGKNLFDVKNVFSSGSSGGGHSGGGGENPTGWGRTFFIKCSWQFSKF
ncbi:MAG: TonB-dependent receptor [Bacteroidales bacterium]